MRKWFSLLILSAMLVSCQSVAPTPLLFGDLKEYNNQTISLYQDCSEGANYVPSKEGCDPESLETQTKATMDLAKVFISADIKQPQGYDVYLQTAMIYFRISQRNEDEYSEAERIARQFFEVQKGTSGRAINDARFYWAAVASGHAAWQWYNDRLALDDERKSDLLLCYAEGSIALNEIEPGPRKVRLSQYLQTLQKITEALP